MDTTWSTTTRILILVMLLATAVWTAVVASPLLQAVGIATLLGYLLDPAVRFLMRRARMRRSWAAAVTFLLFLLVLVGIPAWLGTVAVTQLLRLETDFLAAVEEIGQRLTQSVVIFGYSFHLPDLLRDLPTVLGDMLAILPGGSLNILSSVTTNLLWGSAVLITLYYFLKDGPRIKPWLADLAPGAYQPEIRRMLDEVDRIWGKFLRVQLLIFVILAVLAAAGTLLVVWLFRSGLVQWSLFGFILMLLLVYTAVQQVDNLWLRPQFLGKQLRLHPGIVFVGLIGALALSGMLGALVIVPIMATMKVVGRYVHRKLLGLPPWPEKASAVANDNDDDVEK
jgi:predicted PurR-regulated permease PerM